MYWIPMKKFQPMREGFYLVTYHHYARNEEIVDVDYWDDLGEFWDEHKDTVTAWAELPNPYREAQNG